MATFTLTADANIDELTGKEGGDFYTTNTYDVNQLTIDQHSLYGLNQVSTAGTSATSIGNISGHIPVGSGVTTQDKIDIVNNIWNNSNRTLTTGVVSTSSSSVDETQFHQWLDSYINKANWKADLSVVPTKYENADAVWSKVL